MKKLFTLLATALLMVGTHTPAQAEPVSDTAILLGVGLAFGLTAGPYIDKAADVLCETAGVERGFAKVWFKKKAAAAYERAGKATGQAVRIATPKIKEFSDKALFRKLGIEQPTLPTTHKGLTAQFKLEGISPTRSFERSTMSRQDMIDAAPALIAALPKLQEEIRLKKLLATSDLSTF